MGYQVWAIDTLGGYASAYNLSKKLRTEVKQMVKFRQFADIKDATQQGKNKGDTFHWDVFSRLVTKGRTLVETNTMPETNFTITQGTLTITEAGNSVPYTGKLDNLSELPVTNIINKQLKRDASEAFDIMAHEQFNSTLLRFVGTNATTGAGVLTTNGTATATNSSAFSTVYHKNIMDTMRERNIAPYSGDDYFALSWPTTLRTFKNNLESIKIYTPEGFGMVKNGEIGRYEKCRFVEQTHIPKGGAADSTTWDPYTNTADAWDNGLSDWIFFFGQDAVAEAIAIPEEIRGKLPGDYGRSKGVAWYYLGGFGIVYTDALNSNILKWDSAS